MDKTRGRRCRYWTRLVSMQLAGYFRWRTIQIGTTTGIVPRGVSVRSSFWMLLAARNTVQKGAPRPPGVLHARGWPTENSDASYRTLQEYRAVDVSIQRGATSRTERREIGSEGGADVQLSDIRGRFPPNWRRSQTGSPPKVGQGHRLPFGI